MEKEIYEKINIELEEGDMNKEVKDLLLYFNQKLSEFLKINNKSAFNILIDEMPKEEMDELIEQIANILKKYELYEDVFKYNYENHEITCKNSLVVIEDFDYFKDEFLDWHWKAPNFFKSNTYKNNILIIACPNDEMNDKADNVEFNIFIRLSGNTDSNYLYKKLLSRYEKNNISNSLSYKDFRIIIENIDEKSQFITDYLYDYSIKHMILSDEKKITKKTFANIKKERTIEKTPKIKKNKIRLEDLVGLENVKSELDKYVNYLKFSKENKIESELYLNLFFLGSPGTGKTTVARLYVHELYKLRFIKKDKLVEIVPNDLIGEYVGQTRRKTRDVLESAKDGVLFIDEAYLLYSNKYKGGQNPYMEEAIVELVKYLEDPKNVVIFAGYPDEMKKIYKANPGIQSRIYGELIFNNYNENELYLILEKDLKNKKMNIDSKSKAKIKDYIKQIMVVDNFGNARSMKQLSQKMIMNHANRSENNKTIDFHDLPIIEAIENRKMGFDIYDR